MSLITNFNPILTKYAGIAALPSTGFAKMIKSPLGRAVNQRAKDTMVANMTPGKLQGVTGMVTGAQSSIPPVNRSTQFMKFPMQNMTTSGLPPMKKTVSATSIT